MQLLRFALTVGCLSLAWPVPKLRADEVLSPERVTALRAQIRANFFVPDPLPALAAKTHRRFTPAPGVKAEAVTYATEFGTRVPAILYLPDPLPAGKIPAFVVVTGHGGDKYSWYSWYAGISFARGGMAVLTYDQAGEGERSGTRQSNAREHDALEGGEVMARRLFGLMLTDVMQGVSYLVSRPEIDPRRIGATGFSMGSFIMAIGGAVEPRLHAVVLAAGGNLSGAGDYWDSSPKLMCQGLPSQSLRFLGDQAAVLYALQATRGPLLIRNGKVDQVITPQKTFEPFFTDLQARTARLHGSRDGVFEFGFKEGTGHRPYFLEQPAVLWLEKQLDFPNWTEARIRRCPKPTSANGRSAPASPPTRTRSAAAAPSPSAATSPAFRARTSASSPPPNGKRTKASSPSPRGPPPPKQPRLEGRAGGPPVRLDPANPQNPGPAGRASPPSRPIRMSRNT